METAKDIDDLRKRMRVNWLKFASIIGVSRSTMWRIRRRGVPSKGPLRVLLLKLDEIYAPSPWDNLTAKQKEPTE